MKSAAGSNDGVVRAAGGERVWFLGNLMTIKCGLAQDDGMTFIEGELHPGHAPPLHIHLEEDEVIYVLEGAIHVRCGDDEFDASPGDCAFVPRGTPHAFRVGPDGARTIMFSTSSLLARFIANGGVPAGDGPAPAASSADLERVSRLAASFDMNVLGPPLP